MSTVQEQAALMVLPNYRHKRAMVKGLQEGTSIRTFSLEPDAPRDGEVVVEGPNYPEVVQWRARVELHNGQVVRVL